MTLRPGEVPGRAIAVFPYLKTTDPIQLGSFSFRSTDDTADLEKDDASNVRETAIINIIPKTICTISYK